MNLIESKFKGIILILLCLIVSDAYAETAMLNGIKFSDISRVEGSGINYQRTKSKHDEIYQALKESKSISAKEMNLTPIKSRGAPGVALLDFDQDGDIDIYVTNGPGTSNSLYSNMYIETGHTYFIDVAKEANAGLSDRDSSGVCYGDIDNDNDDDIYVLSAGGDNVLLENLGNGKFKDITKESGVGGGNKYSPSCSMGDIDNDGYIDIAVANNGIWDDQLPLNIPFKLNQHNQLFKNSGNNTFIDISSTSGFEVHSNFPAGVAGFTWAITMVDYDQDGDIDIFTADDQGSVTPAEFGGVDTGLIHIFQNDGSGNFVDVNIEAGTAISGLWMGLAFGDLNSDGNIDFFASNIGDYMPTNFFEYQPGPYSSRWFLGQPDNTFLDSEITDLVSSAFGWGAVIIDFDNDADFDIVYHGGLDAGMFIDGSNPGLVLENDGMANFKYNNVVLTESVNHNRRSVQGVAIGDLNNDGFVDIVTVSNIDASKDIEALNYQRHGATIDDKAVFFENFKIDPNDENRFVWSGNDFDNGSLSVEINNGNNDNSSMFIKLIGTKGLAKNSTVNRNGYGATIGFKIKGKKRIVQPVIGGSSYASQNSAMYHFGMGKAKKGTVDVLWPGGVKNKLYGVKKGEVINFPEISCSYTQSYKEFHLYKKCIKGALNSLMERKIINKKEKHRFEHSAIRAYIEYKKNKFDKHHVTTD